MQICFTGNATVGAMPAPHSQQLFIQAFLAKLPFYDGPDDRLVVA